MPFVGHASERTFPDVTICMFKLRNFDSKYRCNATEASAWVYYIPTALNYNYILKNYGVRAGLSV